MNREINVILITFLLSFQMSVCSEQDNKKSMSWIQRAVMNTFNITTHVLEIPSIRDMDDSETKRQVVITFKVGDAGCKRLDCWRLEGDTLLLVHTKMQDGSQKLFAHCCEQSEMQQQLRDVQLFFKRLNNYIRSSRALVLGINGDGSNWMQKDDKLWKDYQQDLQKTIESRPEMVYYSMIAGNIHREKNHFTCQLNKSGVVWQAVVDNFKDHRLTE